ncbi:AI-2E family transporter, partial [Rhizobium ruizarguesonis]
MPPPITATSLEKLCSVGRHSGRMPLFPVHLLMENLIFPAVMGRRLEINPFVVFLAILFWTWMWGAVGAMLALPLSLI